jgi:hypothetical protein
VTSWDCCLGDTRDHIRDALGTVLGNAPGTDASSGTRSSTQMYGAAICDQGTSCVSFPAAALVSAVGDTGEELGELFR